MKLPKPLRLGSEKQVSLEATASESAVILRGAGGMKVTLSKRGAAHLSDWLRDWARPRRRLKIWGSGDIQREIGISASTLHKWRKDPDFPQPTQTSNGPIWEQEAVRRFALERPPPGRPPKPKPQGTKPRRPSHRGFAG